MYITTIVYVCIVAWLCDFSFVGLQLIVRYFTILIHVHVLPYRAREGEYLSNVTRG